MSLRSGVIFVTHIMGTHVYLAKVKSIYSTENGDFVIAYTTYRTVEFNNILVCYEIEKVESSTNFFKLSELTIDQIF